MEIQRSMLRSYHVFAKPHPLISVTFSTPTSDYTHFVFGYNQPHVCAERLLFLPTF
jgi:hypothetical protein